MLASSRHAIATVVLLGCTMLAGNAIADGVPVAQATNEQKTKAQELFTAGAEKSKNGDHAGALEDFRGSYDVVASPNSRLMISRELVQLNRFAEAYREAIATEVVAREAAASDPKYAEAFESAKEDKAKVSTQVGFVIVDLTGLNPNGDLVINGRPVTPEERTAGTPVDPGQVEIVLQDSKGVIAKKTVGISPGAKQTVKLAPDAPVTTQPPRKRDTSMHPFDMGQGQLITGIVFAGVGVIGMAMFAGFGAANQSIYSDLEDSCPGNQCPAAKQEDADQGRTFQTAANASVIIGAIGLAAGAAFIIPTFFASKKESASASVSVAIGPASGAVRVDF